MKSNIFFIGCAVCLLVSNFAIANICEIKYTRTACPGQESISYKKCKGQASCSKVKKISSADKCKVLAVKACRNNRLDITKSKVINAIFDGVELKASNDSNDFCTVYDKAEQEFNKCDTK
jgi:hypothetical protein